MESPSYFGEFIESLRISSGFKSKRSFAEASGISPATISRIEAGIQDPAPNTIAILAKHLKGYSQEELQAAAGWMDNNLRDFLMEEGNQDALDRFLDMRPLEKISLYRLMRSNPVVDTNKGNLSHEEVSDQIEFETFIKNPNHNIFFKELLEAPEDRIKDLQKIWEVIKRINETDKK